MDNNDTKGRFRLSLDFGPLRRIFRNGVKPRTLLIAALALFLIVATVYAAITYPTLFRPTGPEPSEPGQFGPGSTDRTCVPTAGADSPAVPVSSGDSAAGSDSGPVVPATAPVAEAAGTQPASSPANEPTPVAAVNPPTALKWPLRGKTLTGFGVTKSATLGDWRQHDGIDIETVEGASVAAAADGRIVAVDRRDDIGLTVVIDHGGGITSVYGCLLVTGRQPGDRIKAGDEIGKAGNSGLSETALGFHLHFEVRRDVDAVDPGNWLK